MKMLNLEQFNEIIARAQVSPRLKKDLRFVASTAHMHEEDWQEAELLSITDRSGTKGILLLAPDDAVYIIAYELSKGIVSRQTGQVQPIICDFCRTWQAGSSAGSISFRKDKKSINSVSFLCCADLQCSWHVRGKTVASRVSKAQLREDITHEQRAERLKVRLRQFISDLKLEAIA